MNRVCRKKRMPALLLCLVLCLTTCLGIGTAAEWRDLSRQRGQAMRLQSLGLFLGVGEGSNGFTDFDLERSPSRAEAVTMLVRALGKDSEAKRLGTTHPFTDVPAWADGYVSYAYGQGLTRGTSDTTFGAWDPATGAMYMTFMLRALGYADGEDFTWDDPWTLAEACGILPLTVDRGDFRRADAVDVTAAALSARLKGTDSTLAQKLIAEGAFSQAAYDRAFQTYEAAMEEVAANAFYQEKERWESDYGTVLLGYVTGSPQSTGYTLCLVTRPAAALDEGLTITLPLANGQAPEQPVLSQDGQTFTYAIHLDEPLTLQTGMVCEAGTYAYTVDLSTGQVSGEAVPLTPLSSVRRNSRLPMTRLWPASLQATGFMSPWRTGWKASCVQCSRHAPPGRPTECITAWTWSTSPAPLWGRGGFWGCPFPGPRLTRTLRPRSWRSAWTEGLSPTPISFPRRSSALTVSPSSGKRAPTAIPWT